RPDPGAAPRPGRVALRHAARARSLLRPAEPPPAGDPGAAPGRVLPAGPVAPVRAEPAGRPARDGPLRPPPAVGAVRAAGHGPVARRGHAPGRPPCGRGRP